MRKELDQASQKHAEEVKQVRQEAEIMRKELDQASQKHAEEVKQVRLEVINVTARLDQSIKKLKSVSDEQSQKFIALNTNF